ncbi:MAG: hypothetical protein GY796_30320 [Chloroflexi bacterium]|nr:hypothetical protein [Chloroflexota bacterium]
MTTFTKTQPAFETSVCYKHTKVTTRLHCNRCNRPMCVKCAKLTPVGYKCPACVNEIKGVYFNGNRWDYGLALLITLPLSLVAAFVFTFIIAGIGWFSWFIAFLAAPVAGRFIAEAVRWGVRRRRSRYLARYVAGCFSVVIVALMIFVLVMDGPLVGSYFLVEPGLLLFVGAGAIMARLR